MRFAPLVAASFGAVATAARDGQVLHGHVVQDINTESSAVAPALTGSEVAVVAFFENKDCTGTPAYLRVEPEVCYGPISRRAGFTLVTAQDGFHGTCPMISGC